MLLINSWDDDLSARNVCYCCFVGKKLTIIFSSLMLNSVNFFYLEKKSILFPAAAKITCRKSTSKNFLDHSDRFRRKLALNVNQLQQDLVNS